MCDIPQLGSLESESRNRRRYLALGLTQSGSGIVQILVNAACRLLHFTFIIVYTVPENIFFRAGQHVVFTEFTTMFTIEFTVGMEGVRHGLLGGIVPGVHQESR